MSSDGKILPPGLAAVLAVGLMLVVSSCMTPSIVATQSIQMGDRANNEYNYQLAIQHYETYLETAPSLGTMRNPLMEAEICRKLAHCYSLTGNYQKAGLYLKQALGIDERQSDNRLNMIEDYRQLGVSKIYTGQYDSALHFLNMAMQLNEGMESSLKAVKKLSIADTYLSRSQLELSMGLFKQAQEDALQAVEIYDTEQNGFGIMEGYLVLAKVAVVTSRVEEARPLLDKSIEAANREEFKLFRQYQVAADIELNLGNPEAAVLARMQALTEARESQIVPQIIWACLRLGDAYNELGDLKRAKQYYREARELEGNIQQSSTLTPSIQMRLGELENAYDLFKASGGQLGIQIATLNLLEEELLANDSDSALSLLNEAMTYFESQEIIEGMGKSSIMQAMVYRNRGDYEAALRALTKAETMPLRPDLDWKVKYNLALTYNAAGDPLAARSNLDLAIDIIEHQRSTITIPAFKWHYLDQKTDVYDTYINLLLSSERVSTEDITRAFELNERARSRTFLDMLYEQNIVSTDPYISRQFALIKENQQLLKLLAEQQAKGISGSYLDEKLKANRAQLAQLEANDNNFNFAAWSSAELVALSDIQADLDAQTAMLELWSGREQLISWKITRDNISFAKSDISNAALHRSVARVRNLIKFGVEDKIVSGFQDLYWQLNPVMQNVFEEYANVIVVPHGPLHFVPFEALFDGSSYVLEQSTLQYSPSASVYHFTTNDKTIHETDNLMWMALVDLQLGGHQGLPGTKMEVDQLAQFYRDNDCTYEEAIKESYFKNYADDYGLIHIATHGVFNRTKPGRSYLLMAPSEEDDGKLMVDEIYDLKLNAQLVALSACETGLGDLSEGDELVGLSRAFIYAGSSSIIVSLWKVDDLSTSILMTRLHQLIDAGVNPDDALAMAKRDLLKANFNPNKKAQNTNNPLYPEAMGNITQVNQSLRNVRGPETIKWHPDLLHVVHSEEAIHTSPYYWAPFIIIGGRVKN